MNKRFVIGTVIGLAIVALVIVGIVIYTNRGGDLANAVDCGSCSGKSSGCAQESGCSASQRTSCGNENAYQRQDIESSDFTSIEKSAVEFYQKTFNEANVSAKAVKSGCCILVTIQKDGKTIDNFRYENGQFIK